MAIALTSFLVTYLLFVFYLAYVAVHIAHDSGKLARAAYLVQVLAWVTIGIGWVLDVVFNVLIGSVLFLEFPHWRRLTFTARCKRHMGASTWRGDVARFFCDALNIFEQHC